MFKRGESALYWGCWRPLTRCFPSIGWPMQVLAWLCAESGTTSILGKQCEEGAVQLAQKWYTKGWSFVVASLIGFLTGLQCPYGNKCCWGHVCPNGPKCFHLSKGLSFFTPHWATQENAGSKVPTCTTCHYHPLSRFVNVKAVFNIPFSSIPCTNPLSNHFCLHPFVMGFTSLIVTYSIEGLVNI
jgi:hypothetical protein